MAFPHIPSDGFQVAIVENNRYVNEKAKKQTKKLNQASDLYIEKNVSVFTIR